MADANTPFALGLYRQVAPAPGNLFLSPYSVSEVLAMALVGARGSTATEMRDVLHLAPPADEAAAEFGRLRRQLLGSGNDRVTLLTADSLWAQPRAPLTAGFLRTIRSDFGAEATPVDFVHAPESAREAINAWVEDRTRGKITDLIGPGMLDPGTRMVLVNAVYFKGRWAAPFEPRLTRPDPFFLTSARSVDVPTMHRVARLRTTVQDGMRFVELPYAGQTLSMVVLLPEDRAGLADAVRRLTPGGLSAALKRLASAGPTEVSLALPRFSITSGFDLGRPLQAMGMTAAFDRDRADFSGMTGDRSLFLSRVVHRAVVEVTEEGTVAAAATGGMIAALAMAQPLEIKVDHPFLFLIRDHATGTILFLGRVVDPR